VAAPTFFGKGALADEASGSTIGISPQITFPASIAANDIAVMGVGCNASSTFTTPSGWTLLGTSLESDAGQSTEWYWRRLDGTEGGQTVTASATFSSTIGGYGQIWVFRGCVTTGDPFEGVGTAGTVSETTPDSSACTTTGADRLVVCLAQLDNDTAFASGYPPSGWTDRGTDASTIGNDWRNYCMDRTEATATTVASAVVGTLGASTRWRTLTFALIPAAGGTVNMDVSFPASSDLDVDAVADLAAAPSFPASSDFDLSAVANLAVEPSFPAAADFDLDTAVNRAVEPSFPAASDFDFETAANLGIEPSFPAASEFSFDMQILGGPVDIDMSFEAASGVAMETSSQTRQFPYPSRRVRRAG